MTPSRTFQKEPAGIELTQDLGQPVHGYTYLLNEFDLTLELHLVQNEFS